MPKKRGFFDHLSAFSVACNADRKSTFEKRIFSTWMSVITVSLFIPHRARRHSFPLICSREIRSRTCTNNSRIDMSCRSLWFLPRQHQTASRLAHMFPQAHQLHLDGSLYNNRFSTFGNTTARSLALIPWTMITTISILGGSYLSSKTLDTILQMASHVRVLKIVD